MRIQDLDGKHICLVGYGREGQAMLAALRSHAPKAKITIADANPDIAARGVGLKLGPTYQDDLDTFDVVIRSSGIPDSPALDFVAHKTLDMTRIFFATIAGSDVRVVGVTGTKGKSTTATLIYNALHAHDPTHTFLMGNIGIPMIEFLDHAKPGNTFVVELSSYMLEHLQYSPHIAVITSFFPEHLDRHGSAANYLQAKMAVTKYQTAGDAVFYNADSPECKQIADASPGRKIPFTHHDFPLRLADTKFKGAHNLSNMAAAFKVATYLLVPEDIALKAIASTDPLPHRLQQLGTHAGITWVNDSISTTPETAIAALKALGDEVETIFLGGFDRGYDFSELAAYLSSDSSVKSIVLFPATGERIKQLLPHGRFNLFETSNMQEAVNWAAKHTPHGKTALLSCASPSYNLYKDFVARGEAFALAVHNLS